ncbi:MAG TPA: Nramp family divalent metal transporter [Solirubrobacteraceae bacterium]|nr:Nramp family divalent metal transporter [Solirubrobacteraceae bacterium]
MSPVESGELALEPGAVGITAPTVLAQILSRGRFRAAMAILGPAFVAAVAYVDPGNFATNFQAGSQYRYLLVWVNVMASLMAMLVQFQTSKLGLVTGKSLPEMCRELYPKRANLMLWIQAEVIAMATDLAEFTGAALGLHLVFGVPLFLAGLVTGVVAFIILGLEQRGYRRFELAIIALLALVALGFFADFFLVGHQSYGGIARGLVPRLHGASSLSLAVGIIGATVMPHVVYLHSALQKDRIRPVNMRERRMLLRYNKLDCVVGLSLAGLVNCAMLCVAAALVARSGLIGDGDLGVVHAQLIKYVGGGAALAFGVALIASGLSASSVGTYSGQIVMTGFMNWRIPLVVRRLLTMLPSLVVLALAVNTTDALVYSQIVLSFGIPFALIPLLMLTRRTDVMGEMVNRALTTGAMYLVTGVIVALNIYLLVTTVAGLF